jgi:hypothetical protein
MSDSRGGVALFGGGCEWIWIIIIIVILLFCTGSFGGFGYDCK